MRPQEREGVASTQLTPEQISQGVALYTKLAETQTAYDVARNTGGTYDPATEKQIADIKSSIQQFNVSTQTQGKAPKTEKSRTPLKDAFGKIIGWNVVYSDETSAFVANPDYGKTTTSTSQDILTANQNDAIAAVSALLKNWGIGDVSNAIIEAVQKGYTSETIQLLMQDPTGTDPLAIAFQKRFPANKLRVAAGKPALSPGEYLAAERTYAQVFQAYGLSNMAKKTLYDSFIGNDVSAAEVSDRIGLAVNRVQNADDFTKQALKNFYPALNQSDLISAMLDPVEGLPALQRKVQVAEIGGAAMAQGLNKSLESADISRYAKTAEELATLGVTKAQAQEEYGKIAQKLPRGQFLGEITKQEGIDYTQALAEDISFKGLASQKRKEELLTQREISRFAGSAGTNRASLTKKEAGLI